MDTWSSAEEEATSPANADCPHCKGAGFVHPTLASGKPDFRRVVTCRCLKEETGQQRRTRLEKYSNLGALGRLTFENLIPQGRSGYPINQQRFQEAYEAAGKFTKNPEGWLALSGPSGSGKTHLAAAIANERIETGQPVLYKTTPDLLDDLRAAFNPDNEAPYDQTFEQVRNTPLLILDDLGTQSSTPWAREKLDQLLTYRFSQQLPTVIASGTPLNRLDDRIRSRILDAERCRLLVLEEHQAETMDYGWGPGLKLQQEMTFKSFDWQRLNLPPEQRENLERIYRLALDYAKSPEGWLVFQGVTGCGKTHLAAAIVNHRYQAGQPARFVVVPELLDHLRSSFSPDARTSYDSLFESIKVAPLLVLDDFGEQTATPWAQEKLYQIINYRYNAQLPTVVTTRTSLEEIESRISSRFTDPKISTVFGITAPDYRSDVSSRKSGAARRGHGRR